MSGPSGQQSKVKIVEKKYSLDDDQGQVTFLLIRLDTSWLLWIGESAQSAHMSDLSLACGHHSTQVLSTTRHELSPALASKLSLKYNNSRPVYVALNHPMADKNDNQFVVSLNKKIIEFLNENLS